MRQEMTEVEFDDDPIQAQPSALRSARSGRSRARAVAAVVVASACVWWAAGPATTEGRAVGLTSDLTVKRHEVWRATASAVVASVGDVVLVRDREELVALRLSDGQRVWEAGPSCALTDLEGAALPPSSSADALDPDQTRVLCTTPGETSDVRVLALDPRSGAAVAAPRPAGSSDGAMLTRPAGGGAQVRTATNGSGSLVTVVGDSGRELWHTPGFERPVPIDTPLLRGVVLVSDSFGALAAVDVSTGLRRWALPSATALFAVDGVVGVTSTADEASGALSVLDEATGRELWSAGFSSASSWPGLVCDGERVGTAEMVGRDGVLVVRDVATGATVATWDLPEDAPSSVVALPGGRLAQVTAESVVVLN